VSLLLCNIAPTHALLPEPYTPDLLARNTFCF
jgi:hypothetical protein